MEKKNMGLLSKPIEVFYSYADEDESLCIELDNHLSQLQREGLITVWNKRRIVAGMDKEKALDQYLSTASLILLLVSPSFLASDYCYGTEMQRAMERHNAGEARVIPILLRSTDWQNASLNKLQALPSNGRPVTLWSDRDAAFVNIIQGIRAVLQKNGSSIVKKLSTAPLIMSRMSASLYRRPQISLQKQPVFSRSAIAIILLLVLIVVSSHMFDRQLSSTSDKQQPSISPSTRTPQTTSTSHMKTSISTPTGTPTSIPSPISTLSPTSIPSLTPILKPLEWTTTHTYTGNGAKQTEVFTVDNDWKLLWTCDPASLPPYAGQQYRLSVAVYGPNYLIIDPSAVNTVCRTGNTSGSTEEHQGGQVYFMVDNIVGSWVLKVQELR